MPCTASSPPAYLTKLFWQADEAVFWDSEGVLKPTSPIKEPDQQRGSIMWAFITKLVYGRPARNIWPIWLGIGTPGSEQKTRGAGARSAPRHC
jgi:hypothetical protein